MAQAGGSGARVHDCVAVLASSDGLSAFLAATVEPGATVATDGWRAYPSATVKAGVLHQPHVVSGSGDKAHEILPGVHRVFSLSKRVIEGTYQGGVQDGHLQAYLDEYVFRFNRRTVRARGLLFLRLLEHAVATTPTPYRSLIVERRPDPRPRPVAGIRRSPTSLAGRPLDRPWRRAAQSRQRNG